MKRPIDAVYQNGTFRPLEPGAVDIPDGQRVRITVEGEAEPGALGLATSVYDGLSERQIDDIEQVALDRSNYNRTIRYLA